MKKVTAFVGSARKGNTYGAVVQFLGNLQAMGDVETEIVRLDDYRLGVCRGCRVCFEKGEEKCPFKDDRDALIEKMLASDGVIFASPNYSFQVSGMLKVFLDRLGFAFHRPRFFGKTYSSIVTQGIYGGQKVVDYLDFVGAALGFNTVKGSCLMMLLPMTENQQQKMDRALAAQAQRYFARLHQPAYPAPSLIYLWFFRMGRTKMRLELNDTSLDYRHYMERGWFESDFFYPVHLGILKKGAGRLFDSLSTRMAKAR
jgi:multimeric flavodoxin WrbA